jgi:hypothetical protein
MFAEKDGTRIDPLHVEALRRPRPTSASVESASL